MRRDKLPVSLGKLAYYGPIIVCCPRPLAFFTALPRAGAVAMLTNCQQPPQISTNTAGDRAPVWRGALLFVITYTALTPVLFVITYTALTPVLFVITYTALTPALFVITYTALTPVFFVITYTGALRCTDTCLVCNYLHWGCTDSCSSSNTLFVITCTLNFSRQFRTSLCLYLLFELLLF